MDRVAESIEALADSLVATRPDRNTIVATLRGFAQYVLEEEAMKPIRARESVDRLLDSLRVGNT